MRESKKDQSEVSDSSTRDDLPKVDELVSQIFAGWAQPEGSKNKAFEYTLDQQNTLSYLGVLLEELFASQFPDGNAQVMSYWALDLTSFIEDSHDSKLSFFAKAAPDQFCLISSTPNLFYNVDESSFEDFALELLSQMNNRIFADFLVSLNFYKLAPNLIDLQSIEERQDCLIYSLEITQDFKKFPVLVVFSRTLIDLLIA